MGRKYSQISHQIYFCAKIFKYCTANGIFAFCYVAKLYDKNATQSIKTSPLLLNFKHQVAQSNSNNYAKTEAWRLAFTPEDDALRDTAMCMADCRIYQNQCVTKKQVKEKALRLEFISLHTEGEEKNGLLLDFLNQVHEVSVSRSILIIVIRTTTQVINRKKRVKYSFLNIFKYIS